jgi:2-oxoglutarate ferredoxin oxidoreductase subunit delta
MIGKNRDTRGQKKKGTMEISIERKWCKNCGICVEFCPKNVFIVGKLNEPIISASEDCTNCHLCELRCPEFAITVIEMEAKADG